MVRNCNRDDIPVSVKLAFTVVHVPGLLGSELAIQEKEQSCCTKALNCHSREEGILHTLLAEGPQTAPWVEEVMLLLCGL